eukprot:1642528-Amphidinium_carterae.1
MGEANCSNIHILGGCGGPKFKSLRQLLLSCVISYRNTRLCILKNNPLCQEQDTPTSRVAPHHPWSAFVLSG